MEEILNNEAARKATTLGPRITDLRDSITAYLAPYRFIRRSHVSYMTQSARQLAEQLDERSRRKLTTEASQPLRWLESTTETVALEGDQSRPEREVP